MVVIIIGILCSHTASRKSQRKARRICLLLSTYTGDWLVVFVNLLFLSRGGCKNQVANNYYSYRKLHNPPRSPVKSDRARMVNVVFHSFLPFFFFPSVFSMFTWLFCCVVVSRSVSFSLIDLPSSVVNQCRQ